MPSRSLEWKRTELSAFLRHHRARLQPADVGLPGSGRRRTRGLRREEVAALAGVGLTWYTWFEQGRDIGVSEAFVLNVARALKLSDAECCHLFLLAHRRPPPAHTLAPPDIGPRFQEILDALADKPAFILDLGWNILAWNDAADTILHLASGDRCDRNLLRRVFTDPGLRARHNSFHEDGPRLIASLRYDLAIAPESPPLLALVEDLKRQSPHFRRWWDRPAEGGYFRAISTLQAGNDEIHFDHETLTVDEHRHLRMIVCFPHRAAGGRG